MVPLIMNSDENTRNKFKKIISKLSLKIIKLTKKIIKRKKYQFGRLKFLKLMDGL